MLPSAKHLYPTGNYTFMQDNAPVHTSVSNKKFLQDSGVNVLPWPGQSPDLNPIENLWAYRKHQVGGMHFSNTDELFSKLESVWNSNPLHYVRKLIDSMPVRCKMVRNRYGFHSKY